MLQCWRLSDRDLVGYGGCPPHPQWPGKARVAVQFVLNIEEGAESCILNGDTRSEAYTCGFTAKVVACIEDPVITKKILMHLEEQARYPSLATERLV